MYKIRFNLGKGDNFRKWQIKNVETKEVEHLDPEVFSLKLHNVTLCNRKQTAKRINEGANKSVCAWMLCKFYEIGQQYEPINDNLKLSYNPKLNPYWTDSEGNDIDDKVFNLLQTVSNKVYNLSK